MGLITLGSTLKHKLFFIVVFNNHVTIFWGYVFKIVKVSTSYEQDFLFGVTATHGVVIGAVPAPTLELCELGFVCWFSQSSSQRISFSR